MKTLNCDSLKVIYCTLHVMELFTGFAATAYSVNGAWFDTKCPFHHYTILSSGSSYTHLIKYFVVFIKIKE